MNKKRTVIIVIGIVLVLMIGFIVYKFAVPAKNSEARGDEEAVPQDLEALNPSVQVTISKSKVKGNTVVFIRAGTG